MLAGLPLLGLAPRVELTLWLLVPAVVLVAVSRPVLNLRVRNWAGSIAVGFGVFVVWVAPDLMFPAYRELMPFYNPTTARYADDPLALALRVARAAILVPIIEELFWRAWLPRWIIRADFRTVPQGRYTPAAFWITAVLFATEHGAYWDVALVAGIAYNAWMWRTRSLGDCVLAHAITNACLCGYAISAGRWQYLG